MSKLTAGEIAEIDQGAAALSDELAVLVRAVRMGDGEAGEAQCLCDFTAFLAGKYGPSALAALVVVAARQIGARP